LDLAAEVIEPSEQARQHITQPTGKLHSEAASDLAVTHRGMGNY
jgi:hypothetical protein